MQAEGSEAIVSSERSSRAIELDGVVYELNQLVREATVDLSLRVGALVVERFFGGRADGWRDRQSRSFRQLARHPDLPMSASALRRSVGLFELTERVGALSQFARLGASHFRCVLGLEQEQQRELLQLANDRGWTVNELDAHVAAQRTAHSQKGGRPRLPPLIKAMRRLGPLTEETRALLSRGMETDELTEVDVHEARALAGRVASLLNALERRFPGAGQEDQLKPA